jgi:dienelactone hydrolase
MNVRTRLLGPDDRILDYRMSTAEGDSINMSVKEDRVSMMMVNVEGRNAKLHMLEGTRGLPLDNAVAQHLWLLARQVQRDPKLDEPVTLLIPQRLFAGPLEPGSVEDKTGRLGEVRHPVKRYTLRFGGIYSEFEVDEAGRFMSMAVPIRGFEARRKDYEPEKKKMTLAPMNQEDVLIEGGGPALGGSLTLPSRGEGPFPACVILHGSGRVDRDFTVGPNKIFRQIAEDLSRHGIASLRYDKRTQVMTWQGIAETETGYDDGLTLKEEVLDDALAALRLLASDERIDPDGLFILGHHLGGAAAPPLAKMAAAVGIDVAGLVLLAPLGRDLMTVVLERYRSLNRMGLLEQDELARYEGQVEQYQTGAVADDNMIFFAKPRYWDTLVFWNPWRDFTQQQAPAYIVFGGKDWQITEDDRTKWEQILAESPHAGSEIVLKPELNHLFMKSRGEPGPAEYGMEGFVDRMMIKEAAEWMKAQQAAPGR